MPKVISIVGKSSSGKTTLLEKVVRELAGRGFRIGTVKHDTHGFEIDHPGKDSYRHFHAGSRMTMILGPDRLALVKRFDKPPALDDALRVFFKDKYHKLDLIITEGFKRGDKPKIEIVRSEALRVRSAPNEASGRKAQSTEPICRPKGDRLVALVSDIKIPDYNVPQFGLNEIKKITDFIERKFIATKTRRH